MRWPLNSASGIVRTASTRQATSWKRSVPSSIGSCANIVSRDFDRRSPPSMHAFELHSERPLDGRLKCCHAPLIDALAPRRYRLRFSERHLGDAVAGDDVAIRQQVAGGVCVPVIKILVAPVARAELL